MLCCVALCVVMLCGPPNGGACCVIVWPPSWWGVLWWSVAPLLVGRASLGCVGRLFSVVAWLLLGRVGRGGLPSACGAPPRVVVSRLSSPCRSFSLVPLYCVCAVVGRVLVGALFCPPPPARGGSAWRVSSSRRCSSFLSVLAGFRCWPPAGGCPRWSCLPPPPRAGSGFVVACLRLLVVAPAPCCPCSPRAVSAPRPLLHPVWFVLRGCCRPAALFSLRSRCLFAAALCLVCWRASALAVAPPARPSLLGLCFAGGASVPFVLALPAFSALLSAVCLRLVLPPPPLCLSLFCGRCCPCCFAFLRAVLGGPGCGVPCRVVLRVWCGATFCCLGLPCAVWCLSLLCGAAASGVAPCVLLSVNLCAAVWGVQQRNPHNQTTTRTEGRTRQDSETHACPKTTSKLPVVGLVQRSVDTTSNGEENNSMFRHSEVWSRQEKAAPQHPQRQSSTRPARRKTK